ncbi:fimbrial biogenesis chaperone [Ewingella americana]|uniref:fimbrial biogenesis chaperone n=1 Tax=Ewingella americana TaxID=41202 RepID=UPI0012ADA919|nr:molecular chaperone [Ewingella americana]MRT05945.1 fimbria/pilus periplasmic chaperone [Ewingella americana]
MRTLPLLLSSALLLLACAGTASANLVVGGTRVIYPENSKEISVSIKNPDKNTDYLVQSRLDNDNEKNTAKVPFVITPPLFRLDHQSENVLRIARAGGKLPADRESLYWLSVRGIAGTAGKPKENQLQVVINQRLKYFFRPAALNNHDAAEAYQKLTFSRLGGELVMKNPTPYYVSLYTLKVGGTEIQTPGMVPPFGEHRVKTNGSGAIEWQAINDYGGHTATAHQ